jgi:hypothetical protein
LRRRRRDERPVPPMMRKRAAVLAGEPQAPRGPAWRCRHFDDASASFRGRRPSWGHDNDRDWPMAPVHPRAGPDRPGGACPRRCRVTPTPSATSTAAGTALAQARATKTATSFRQSCAIRCEIHAPAERIWALLTDARRIPAWTSTVTRLDGEIALGRKLAVVVPLAPKRTFRPKVTKLAANETMEWSDGFAPMFRGVRTFTLTARTAGLTEFAMIEVFSGLMLPMIRRGLPDFAPAFEAYAADLKRAAEERTQSSA